MCHLCQSELISAAGLHGDRIETLEDAIQKLAARSTLCRPTLSYTSTQDSGLTFVTPLRTVQPETGRC